MSKKKQNNQPGERGVFYSQKLCPVCKKLIVGSSPKSHRAANSDLEQRLRAHQEQHQKEGKQLNLSMSGTEENQTESVERVTLRGEKKPALWHSSAEANERYPAETEKLSQQDSDWTKKVLQYIQVSGILNREK